MQIKFYWSTFEGCEWLNETIEVNTNETSITEVAEDYYDRTKTEADMLVAGWQRNGEDVSLYPSSEQVGEYNPLVGDLIDRAFGR